MSWRARGHECDGLTAPADDREGFAAIIGSGAVVGEITVGGTVAVFSPAWRSGIFGAFAYVALRSGCRRDAGAWTTRDGSVETEPSQAAVRGARSRAHRLSPTLTNHGPAVVRIASYNVENLFARPKVFRTADWSVGEPKLAAYEQVSALFKQDAYSAQDKADMKSLLVELDIYFVNAHDAVRRKETSSPRWAWLRKNRGGFDRQPEDETKDIEIIADSRDDWIGWVELAKEAVDETSTRMTAKVIDKGVDADIIAVVEAEDRPSLLWFNEELLDEKYRHVMLVDGNDSRGIDVGIMTKSGLPIRTIRSNVDAEDTQGIIFSRDCPEYEVVTQNGTHLFVLVNHFKSQSGGGGEKRQRQAKEVRQIVDRLVGEDKHVIVLGDLNEGPNTVGTQAANFSALFDNNSPLADVYSLPGFNVGPRPGTFDSCGIRNRLDYILISQSLVPAFHGGEIFREGLWGTRVTRPTAWETYPEIENGNQQASDHAAVFVDLNV